MSNITLNKDFLLDLNGVLNRYEKGFIFICINDDNIHNEVVEYINKTFNSVSYSLLLHYQNCGLIYHIENYYKDYNILIVNHIEEYNELVNDTGYQKLEFVREALINLNKVYILICKENELRFFANKLPNIFSWREIVIYYD